MAFKGMQWFVADLHFEHPGIVKERDGVRNRPFTTVEEHDEHVIARWNERVGAADKVYVLGDVCMKKAGLAKVARLNGKKHLIKGNHDIFELAEYAKYFYEVSAYRVFQAEKFICSHLPVHPMELERFGFNVHGHLHDKCVQLERITISNNVEQVPDPRYLCVSLEQFGYCSISMEQLLSIRENRGL
jgi:calcineurin-like phosphoesterase family protein